MGQILPNDSGGALSHTICLIKLALRYGINPKTVAKLRKRKIVKGAPMWPKEAHSTALSP